MKLEGRRVLVTGATGGLGHAIVRALAARGASLVITGRRVEPLEALAADTGAETIGCDLIDPAEVDRLITDAGRVDVLVANAGLPASGPIERFAVQDIDAALAVNLRAPIVLARGLLGPMAERGEGHLVFVSSLSGKAATVGTALYAATKFGLRGFAQALREDLHPRGVGVSTVFPGFIREAGMFHESRAKLPGYVGTKRPEDVGRAVADAIERERSEVDVAPLGVRLGVLAMRVAPGPAARVQRRLGSVRVASQIAEGQRSKRR